MSIHIGAKPGDIAETVFIAGDPLRAKYMANKYLSDVSCYNEVRGMYGYTGNYQGKRISVQGTGMGIPSTAIYVNELIREYQVKTLVRIGSCGSLQPHIKLYDLVVGMSASTDSSINKLQFNGMDFAACADFGLLHKAYTFAEQQKFPVKVGHILSTDVFYDEDPEAWKLWSRYGVLAVEMESNCLYTLAAKYGIQALSLLTVSDSLVTKEAISSEEREKSFDQMMQTALSLLG
ncbi:MAG: purine-nucleoside phosphorylase [Oligoflexales bacterium]|nr:purine-nucleoside phosphorylase [Oligoflexales bacterium]